MVKKVVAAVVGCFIGLMVSFPSMAAYSLSDQAQCPDVNGTIATIRGMYNRTKTGNYITKGNQLIRNEGDWSAVIRTVTGTGDELLDPIMKKYGYQTYSLEYYYDNSDYERKYVSGINGPNFIYAVINGKEYRYYFQENSMIRRIGPEGTISDNPKTNEFLNLLYQAGCYYQHDLSIYSAVRNLQEESIVFSSNYYDLQNRIIVQAGIMESFERGGSEYGVFVVDADTKVSDIIHKEATWRQGDNGYTWLKRYLETDPTEGGYMMGLDCFCVKTTGSHVDSIEEIYATH